MREPTEEGGKAVAMFQPLAMRVMPLALSFRRRRTWSPL